MAIYTTINLRVALPAEALEGDVVANHERNRNALRALVIQEFLKESAGKGTGQLAANFKYEVESISGGNTIFLTRPVPLNKGFDFIVHVGGATFSNKKTNPKHDDIVNDIKAKIDSIRSRDSSLTKGFKDSMLEMIEKVFYCIDPELIIENFELDEEFRDVPGLSYEVLLKSLKWLFIEQDIRYWNWSGRGMLMKGLRELLA